MSIKKAFILSVLFCFSTFVFSQEKEFNIDWKEVNVSNSSKGVSNNVHGFQSENFIFDLDTKQLVYGTNLKFSASSANIISVNYGNLSNDQLKGYDLKRIKDEVDFKIVRTTARGINGSYLEFNPIVKTSDGYKKVLSIKFNFPQSNKSASASLYSLPAPAISDSEMSSGDWYRFYIERTGVYKLDKNFLASLGINVNGVNPKNIRLFGNGGKSIPLANSEIDEFDVTENAVKFVGEQDGVFNNDDYMLFYGVSSLGWSTDNNSNINPYTDKTYYYINVGGNAGKRIQSLIEPSGAVTNIFTTFDEYQYYELDKNNLVQLGRKWFGDSFDVNSNQSFSFNFPRIDVSQQVRLKVEAAATATSSTSMGLFLNGSNMPFHTFNFGIINSIVLASGRTYNNFIAPSENITIDLKYNNGGNPSANAYLDFISLEATSFLRSLGKQFSFRNNISATTSGVGEYVITDASTVSEVWDVTDIFNVRTKSNNGSNAFSFKTSLGSLREYVSVVASDYYQPLKELSSVVSNVNLKGTIFKGANGVHEDVDYIVVTPTVLKSQADRLAAINASVLGLRTRVVYFR